MKSLSGLVVAVLLGVVSAWMVAASTPIFVAEDNKLYSYVCLNSNQQLCLGISTSQQSPVYDPNALYNLQVKLRDKNEMKGLDWMKMRWSVYRKMGRVQLANFTSLCIAKQIPNIATPGEVVLRPCDITDDLQTWALDAFLTNINEQAVIKLRTVKNQCLTLMTCNRGDTPSTDYCDPFTTTAYMGSSYDEQALRGAYVKMMPCQANSTNQQWRQTLDCAPGCSPFMMSGSDNKCDKACANDACNWDNRACATPSPTPPTPLPTHSPSVSPTTSLPTTSPTSAPTKSPTTSKPSTSPSSVPTKSPSTSKPTLSPTVSRPTTAPTWTPTKSPTSTPSLSPTSSPSWTPSQAPTTVPSSAPSWVPTSTPTQVPSTSPTYALLASKSIDSTTDLLWLWILLAVLGGLLLCCCCFFIGFREKKKRDDKRRLKEELERQKMGEQSPDIESPVRNPRPASNQEVDLSAPNNSSSPSVVRNLFPTFAAAAASRSAASDHHELSEDPEVEINLVDTANSTSAPANADTPRTAAAKQSLSPDPEKKPRGGAPGLAWGGSQADLSGKARSERTDIHEQSEILQRTQLPGSLNERSFRMPKEKVTEGEGSVDVSLLAKGASATPSKGDSGDPKFVKVNINEGTTMPDAPREDELSPI